MCPYVRDNAMPLLRTAAVGVFFALLQDFRLEFIDSLKDRHPSLLDGLNTQAQIRFHSQGTRVA